MQQKNTDFLMETDIGLIFNDIGISESNSNDQHDCDKNILELFPTFIDQLVNNVNLNEKNSLVTGETNLALVDINSADNLNDPNFAKKSTSEPFIAVEIEIDHSRTFVGTLVDQTIENKFDKSDRTYLQTTQNDLSSLTESDSLNSVHALTKDLHELFIKTGFVPANISSQSTIHETTQNGIFLGIESSSKNFLHTENKVSVMQKFLIRKNNNNRNIIKQAISENKKVLPVKAKIFACDAKQYDEFKKRYASSKVFQQNRNLLEQAIREDKDVTFCGWELYIVGTREHQQKCKKIKERVKNFRVYHSRFKNKFFRKLPLIRVLECL